MVELTEHPYLCFLLLFVCFVLFYFVLFFENKYILHYILQAVLDSLCSPCWPQTVGNLPASAFGELDYTPVPACSVFLYLLIYVERKPTFNQLDFS